MRMHTQTSLIPKLRFHLGTEATGMAVEVDATLQQIRKAVDALQIDASVHREAEAEKTKELISGYEQSLRCLSDYLSSLSKLLNQDDPAQKRTILKEHIPQLAIVVVAHCGRHYWTSAATRRLAQALVSQMLQVCGCGSILELLVGELPSGYSHASPYLPVRDGSNLQSRESTKGGLEKDTAVGEQMQEKDSIDEDGGESAKIEQIAASPHDGTRGRIEGKVSGLGGSETQLETVNSSHCDEESKATPQAAQVEGRRQANSLGEVAHTVQLTTDPSTIGAQLMESTAPNVVVDSFSDPIATEVSGNEATTVVKGGSVAQATDIGSREEPSIVFRSGLLKSILSILKKKLTKDSWKKHPTSKHALVWCLRHLKHPHMSPYLDSFLPPLLMLLDDHETYHKVLGLSAVTHLIENVDPTELRWYGRDKVIYEAIKNFQYVSEVELIHALHPCMVCLLPVLEGPTARTVEAPRKPSKSDEVFAIFLNSLDYETKLAVRKALIAHMSSYIELLGVYSARHLKRLLSVLFSCLEFPDYSGEETRTLALKSLATLIAHVWPRIPYHKDEILKALLKLVSDLCPSSEEIPDKPEVQAQLPLITECLVLLARCSTGMEDYYQALQLNCEHKGMLFCIEKCFEKL